MTSYETDNVSGRGSLAKSEVGRKQIVEDETYGITDNGGRHSRKTDGIDENYVDTVLQHCCHPPRNAETQYFRQPAFSLNYLFHS